ncbi:hypothetical protein EV580_1308 [Mycobacterium sp. BK086]|uniref:hypothetical protein n=1 Tax=Mycobacterium sp. BK086 TaxID=2512165 RepID=UPI00106159BB|nr:hypothetical protein [Mycobacterium sp. BK086]TDO18126.1 hypothetical protein EV580_1308 [Mycobacterium sp. BK086]
MPFSNAAMVVGTNAIRSACGGMRLHTDNPGDGAAANRSSAPMQVPTWTVVTGDGDYGLAAPVNFTGCAPNGDIKWVSLWTNTSPGAVWMGNFLLSGDLTADADGNYTVSALAVDGSSS